MNLAANLSVDPGGDWNANGWTLIGGFLPADGIAALRREADRLCQDQTLFGTRGAVPKSATRNDRLDPVID